MSTKNPASSEAPARTAWSFLIYVPPPFLFVGTFVAGALLHRLLPQDSLPAAIAPITWLVGVVVIACSAMLLVTAPGLFLVDRTTIIPHATSRALVTRGPFRLTRNPMYLALAAAYVGIALVLNLAWPLLFLALPLWITHTKIIPREEWALTQVFGDEYLAYQQRVRRWI